MRGHEDIAGRRPEVLSRILTVADLILIAIVIFGAVELGFAFQLHRHLAIKLLFTGIVFFSAAARWFGPPAVRINAALMLIPIVGALLAYQTYHTWRRPRDGTAAHLAGRPFDSRGLWEVIESERRSDPAATAYMIPRALLTHQLVLEHWQPEPRTVRKDWGIVVDGVRTLPLAGISMRRTVFCNESGTAVIYDSDEHGFNNPRGIWNSEDVQVVILGDSFSHGACVASEATTAGRLRRAYPRTLNLGMSGNGPLMEYAALKEYVADLRPPIVLWVYYVNDLSDLEVEKDAAVLRRYLDDEGFRQGLAPRQPRIDSALEGYIDALIRRTAPRWPAALDGVGLTRRTTPLWLQDLVTTEEHSSLSAILRLDAVSWYVTKRFLERNTFAEAADYALFERILRAARDTVAAWGGHLYFVYLPAVHHLDGRYPNVPGRPEVLELVGRLGIPAIDIHQVFLAQPDPERFRFHYESHANEEGYALHAETILAALDQGGRR